MPKKKKSIIKKTQEEVENKPKVQTPTPVVPQDNAVAPDAPVYQ